MQDNIKEQLKEEWENSEVSKRITSTECFAINHHFEEWNKPTVLDFWLSKIDELLKSQRESLVEKIEKLKMEELFIGETQYRHYKGNVAWVRNQGLDEIINLIKED